MSATATKSIYESSDVWDQPLTLGQQRLVESVLDFWPQGVRDIIDVGCGDGKITRCIAGRTAADVIGYDISCEALSRLELPGVRGTAEALAFVDRAVDMVCCFDTLEHLDAVSESAAWSEFFRVARHWVMVAVPYRECLLESMAECGECSTRYHVNWHQRSYAPLDLICRVPDGWHVAAAVLTGEAWSTVPPEETVLRRQVFGEWAHWDQAACPSCGRPTAQRQSSELHAPLARWLGSRIYDRHSDNPVFRNHTEILFLFRRNGTMVAHPPVQTIPLKRRPTGAVDIGAAGASLSPMLHSFPLFAHVVLGAHGEWIVQFPVYSTVVGLRISGKAGSVVKPRVVDGCGALFEETVTIGDCETLVALPRSAVPSRYGLLVYLEPSSTLSRIGLIETGPVSAHCAASPPGRHAYLRIEQGDWSWWTRVDGDAWIGADELDPCWPPDLTPDRMMEQMLRGALAEAGLT